MCTKVYDITYCVIHSLERYDKQKLGINKMHFLIVFTLRSNALFITTAIFLTYYDNSKTY